MKNDQYNDYLKKVGNNIRRIRNEQVLSMEDVADLANIDFRQLGRIERGEGNTTLISYLRIAEVLKVDVHIFFILKNEDA